MRIICLDIGTKRIGVAATDPMGWSAQPVSVVLRRERSGELADLVSIVKDLDAEKLIIGLPLDSESREAKAAQKVKAYAEKIRAALATANIDIPIEFWDERYSTKVAEERLIGADVSRKRRKEVIDKMAAVVILEDYLEAHEPAASNDEGVRG